MLKLISIANLLLFSILLLTCQTQDNQKVVIDMYTESLCPDCIDFMTTSLKTAINTQNFFEIAELNLYPYGNAKESYQSNKWVFTCQHGTNECYGNLMEVCTLNKVQSPENLQFIVCLEQKVGLYRNNFDKAAQICATNYNIDTTDIYSCMNSNEGNELQHQVAVQTNNLQPPHTYVPWIVANGQHNTTTENAIIKNMVSWTCQNYKGSVKINACQNQIDELQ